jgi:tRNA-Thr(GGU) m(6)t(6)A37 methyltransferase TsaA
MESQAVVPIGVVRNRIDEAIDDVWGGLESRIELDADRFEDDALAGLDTFSHVEIVFLFNRVQEDELEYGARHPRGRKDWPLVGIFAQRGKNRPNRIGITSCRVVGVEGRTLIVEGLDAIAGTPVLDIKPYMKEFGPRGDVRQPEWATELMSGYWSS